MNLTLVVLAAGMGSRYGGIKQMESVSSSGDLILDFSVYDAIRAGFGKIVFVIREAIEKDFKELVSNRYGAVVEIVLVNQKLEDLPNGFTVPSDREKPWGTGQATLAASPVIDGPFAVINADDFYGRSGFQLIADYLNGLKKDDSSTYCMVGYVLENTLSEHGSVSRGVCSADNDSFLIEAKEHTELRRVEDGSLKSFSKEGSPADMTGKELVSMNMWGFTAPFFVHLNHLFVEFLEDNKESAKSEFYLPFAVNSLLEAGEVKAKILKSDDSWFGVTYPDDLPNVIESIEDLKSGGVYPDKLF